MELPFLVDPTRMLSRILDDVHDIAVGVKTIAGVARTLPDVEARLTDRFAELDGRIDTTLLAVAQVEARVGELVALAEEVRSELAPDVRELTGLARDLKVEIAPQVDELGRAAAKLAAAAEPLTGASERLGRIADRLPMPAVPRRPGRAPRPAS